MLSSLPVKLAKIGGRLDLGKSSAGCGNDLIEVGRHGKLQQLYGREIESLVIDLSKKKSIGKLRRGRRETLVPSKGLEPPHPCGYMDLNHARLPIPPRWQKVIRLRGDPCGAPFRREPQLIFYRGVARCQTFEARVAGFGLQASGFRLQVPEFGCRTLLPLNREERRAEAYSPKPDAEACSPTFYPSSLAFIVMFALSTFDTGQPLLAFSAAFWKAA